MFAFENTSALLLVYISVCAIIYATSLFFKRRSFVHPHLMKKRRNLVGSKQRKTGVLAEDYVKLNILFVIAHPDDECMFFGPTLIHFSQNKDADIRLLCLSAGNFYGEGNKRQRELMESCKIFGLVSKHVFIIDHVEMQDDPAAFWDVDLVANTILKIVKQHQIDQIITFDSYGASSHRNHISVYRGVRYLIAEHLLPKGTQAYSLETVSFFRHYLSFLDLPFSLIMSALRGSRIVLSSPLDVWRTQKAMKAHWSQFVWFRILNIMFSRYLVVNTLGPITKHSPT